MDKWNLRTYTGANKSKPVDEWITGLQAKGRVEVMRTLDLLEDHGTDLKMPHARFLQDGLWELRGQSGSDHFRVIYFHWKGRTFGLVHGFTKKTNKTDQSDITTAKERRATWLARAEARAKR